VDVSFLNANGTVSIEFRREGSESKEAYMFGCITIRREQIPAKRTRKQRSVKGLGFGKRFGKWHGYGNGVIGT